MAKYPEIESKAKNVNKRLCTVSDKAKKYTNETTMKATKADTNPLLTGSISHFAPTSLGCILSEIKPAPFLVSVVVVGLSKYIGAPSLR